LAAQLSIGQLKQDKKPENEKEYESKQMEKPRPLEETQPKAQELKLHQERNKELREKRLTALAEEEQSAKTQMDEQAKKYTMDLDQIKKRIAEVDRIRFRFASGTPESNKIQAEFSQLKQRAKRIEEQIAAQKAKTQNTLDVIEQQRRKARAECPLLGDEEYITYADRLYTKSEIQQLKTLEQEHSAPQLAADTYIRVLLANKTLDSANFLRVEMLSERHVNLDRRFWRVVVYRARYVSQGGFVNDREIGVLVCDPGNGYWFVAPEVKLNGPTVLR
jgi:hypothetical protein